MINIAVYLVTALVILAAAFFVFRFFVRRDYEKKGRLSPLSSFLQLLIFFLHALSSYIYMDPYIRNIRTDRPLFTPAVLCIVVGLGLFLIPLIKLGISRSFGMKVKGLQQSGFYRYTRNPQIVTFSIFYIGCVLLWPSWTGPVWLIICWAICHMMVLTEEEHLRRTFGEEYERYCAKTPRYIGFKTILTPLKS